MVYSNIISLISSGGWSYKDVYTLPVSKRDWIFGKFVELNTPKEDDE
jgi:hypothetical protein